MNGKELCAFRTRHRLSQAVLAKELGVHRNTIHHYEVDDEGLSDIPKWLEYAVHGLVLLETVGIVNVTRAVWGSGGWGGVKTKQKKSK